MVKVKSVVVMIILQMRRVAVGMSAGGCVQAVRVSSRREWCKHEMDRRELVAITGEQVQADRKSVVLVEGQEVWHAWSQGGREAQVRNETEWWKQAKQEWRDRERAAGRSRRLRFRERDQTYDRG